MRNTISFPSQPVLKMASRNAPVGTLYTYGGEGAYMRATDKQIYLNTGALYDLSDAPIVLLPSVTITSPK